MKLAIPPALVPGTPLPARTLPLPDKATFTVVASGANLHYQWYVKHANGATVAVGTDSPSYTTTPEGNGMWFVKVSNACGTVTSDSVTAQTVSPRRRPTG